MKILVTGGAGKVGQWVVRELLKGAGQNPGHEVTVLDRAAGPESSGIRYLLGDVQDLGQVFEAVVGCDAVIHLAAMRNPNVATAKLVFETNVQGTFNVHQAAFRFGVKRVVSTSSIAILGWSYSQQDFEPDYLPVDEDHPVKPQDVYGLSKEIGEDIARCYARKGLETVVLRPSGVVTPDALEQLRRAGGRHPTKFQTYCYIDVRDLATAYRLAVEQPIPDRTVFFVVADDSVVAEPLSDLLSRLMPAVREKARCLTGTQPAVSNRRIKELLGWKPVHSWRHEY